MATVPSLALIPSAYKASKLYSVIPANGDGDFSFVRNSSGTRVNSNGLIETVGVNVPRLDYSDGNCPSLLLEPQRTNLALYSEQFDVADWAKEAFVGSFTPTVTPNTTIAPDGNLTADTVILNINTTGNCFVRQLLSEVSGTTYTFSVWLKGNGTNKIGLAGSNLLKATITPTTQWQKYSITWTASSASLKRFGFYLDSTISNSTTVYAWGAQAEQGSYPTSYIPTNGSIATRIVETCNDAGNASTFNDSEGVLFAEISALADDNTYRQLGITAGSWNNQVNLSFDNVSNRISGIVLSSGTYYVLSHIVSDTKTVLRVALKYKLNDIKFFINGVEVDSKNSANMPIGLNELNFAIGIANLNPFFGKVKQLQYFDTALTDTELQELTTL